MYKSLRLGRQQNSHTLVSCLVALSSMAPLLFSMLGYDLLLFLFSMWMDVPSLANLDVALTCHELRPYWMTLVHSLRAAGIDEWGHSFASLMWLIRRGICARRVQMKVDCWRVFECDLILLQTIDLVHLGLNGCLNITDQCIVNLVYKCYKVNSLEVSRCSGLTDASLSALGAEYGQLQNINLSCRRNLTDAGVSALGAGCGHL